jgi:putative transposase
MCLASQIAEVNALGIQRRGAQTSATTGAHLGRCSDLFCDIMHQNRRQVLASDEVAKVLIDEWHAAHERHGWAVGRYVIMPDHVHFFCRPELDAKTLSEFVGFWKSYTSRKIHALGQPRSPPAATTLWQREFFDHVLRSAESYGEKWNYVRANPVRTGLVSTADDWKYAGEVEILML